MRPSWRPTGMSQENFSGHGSALAQAYNHMIMPLANRRDKYTQVLWGIRDFEHRFQRPPEGMWLPETAVDLETLDIMAELGIRFTILAPHQATQVRQIGQGALAGREPAAASTPPRPYALKLPSGRTIDLFFYDGPISQAVAFEDLLQRGENLAHRLAGAFSAETPLAPVGAYRHRWRNLRPPSALRRHGPDLRPAVHRSRKTWPA